MNFLKAVLAPFALVGKLFTALSFCADAGAIVGVLAGLLFGLLQSEPTAPSIKSGDLPWIALILAGLGLVAVLMILGVWLRYDIASMFWPAVVNALLTSFLTVYTNAAVDVPEIAAPIGLAVGIVVGTILCCLCRWTRLSDCIGVRHV